MREGALYPGPISLDLRKAIGQDTIKDNKGARQRQRERERERERDSLKLSLSLSLSET